MPGHYCTVADKTELLCAGKTIAFGRVTICGSQKIRVRMSVEQNLGGATRVMEDGPDGVKRKRIASQRLGHNFDLQDFCHPPILTLSTWPAVLA
jgi:hypothetical protein